MSINLRLSAADGGTRNTFDNELNFATYGGLPAASAATNSTALDSFNTAYAALSGRTRLTIAPGTYNFNAAINFGRFGGDRLTIEAFNTILTAPGGMSNGFAINAGPNADGLHQALINTVSSGTSTVTLVTGAQTSRFAVNGWVLITNIDMQGFGDPPNAAIFEFKKIASIGSGTLTFTEPLVNAYKSTYPNYGTTFLGGPATVYDLNTTLWNQEIELRGARFTDTSNLFYGKVRVAKYTDCTFDTYGPCPTINLLYRMLRCNCPGTGALEVDKLVQRAEFVDSTPGRVDFQSASINDLYVNNVTSSNRWRGTGRVNYFKNLSTPSFTFSTMNYGVSTSTYMETCDAAAATWTSSNKFPFADYTEEGGGVLSYAGGPCPASNTTGYWAVPGQYCVLTDNNATPGFAQSFQVLDVTASGGRTYVTTTLPFPLPGTINGKSPPWAIYAHPCADATLVSCTGNSLFTSQSALPAHTPLFGWTL